MNILRPILWGGCMLFVSVLFAQKPSKTFAQTFQELLANTQPQEESLLKAAHYFQRQNWDSVLVFSAKSLVQNPTKHSKNLLYYMRGHAFMKKRLFTPAVNEYQQVAENFPLYHQILRNYGGMALEKKEFQKAIDYFQQLQKLPLPKGHSYHQSSVIHDEGIAHFHLKNYKTASKLLAKSAAMQQAAHDTLRLIGSYMDIANVYYVQYKDALAIPYFEKAYALSKHSDNFEMKRKAALNMSVVEENRKNYPAALRYRKEFERWKDSLTSQQKIWSVAQYEKRLALSEKQKEIDLLAAEQQLQINQRNSLLLIASLLLILLMVGLYFYIYKSKSHRIIQEQKDLLQVANETKDKLFSVVSHDLRSSLTLIKYNNERVLKKLPTEVPDDVERIVQTNVRTADTTYHLLENLLHWATLQTEQLYFHTETLHLHSIIEQVSYNFHPLLEHKNIRFFNDVVPGHFITADIDSVKIIFRNLLDNAIKFSPKDSLITAKTSENDEYILFSLEDYGPGMPPELIHALNTPIQKKATQKQPAIQGTGLGMQLCKSLCEKNGAPLLVKSTEGEGTCIEIYFKKATPHE